MSKWKAIKTVPKDGTPVLVCTAGYSEHDEFLEFYPIIVSWRTYHPNAQGEACLRDCHGHKWSGTHWMPVPKSPRVNNKAGGE